jgi:5S rRNA maturation endonuclease (ribonuclease M5)
MPGDLSEWRDRLQRSRKMILVEGPRDEQALREIGITNPILLLHKKPLYAVVEEAAERCKDIVILTDLDKEGKKLFGRLNTDLQAFGVRVDKTFREYLFKNSKLRQIEGISRQMVDAQGD